MANHSNTWWRGASIYQIYPRSYQDSNNDGIGDLPGITSRLEYIASLGVDGIWISPFFTSPMADFGYDVADYCDVDPIFGTLRDFDCLIKTAHQLNLKVIIDQVYSHTSDQHPWFAESRASRRNKKADWYVWADPRKDGSPPNNWQSVFTGAAWTWDARREQYYFHNFLSQQPDLNLHHPAVQRALLRVAEFWLDRGVDGFRLDAINHGMHDPQLRNNPIASHTHYNTSRPYAMQAPIRTTNHRNMPAFLGDIRRCVNRYQQTFTVAEVGGVDPLPIQQLYTAGKNHLHSAYGFEFLGLSELRADAIRSILGQWTGAPNEGWPAWAFSNHDAPRVMSRWCQALPASQRFRLITLLQMVLRGNLFIYQGEELGLPQAHVPFDQLQDPEALKNWPQTQGRDGARTPFPWQAHRIHAGFSEADPWLPVNQGHRVLARNQQEKDSASALNFFRRAMTFRQEHDALRLGKITFPDNHAHLLSAIRHHSEETCVGVFNLSSRKRRWHPPTALAGSTVQQVLQTNTTPLQSLKPLTLQPGEGFIAVL